MSSELQQWLVTLRREFHQYPEPGWLEYRTTARIAQELRKMGVPFQLGSQILSPRKRMGLPDALVDAYWWERAAKQLTGNLSDDRKTHISSNTDECKWLLAMKGGFTGLLACIEGRKQMQECTGGSKNLVLRFDIDANELAESRDLTHRPAKEGFVSFYDDAMHGCGHDGHTAIGLGVAKMLNSMKDRFTGNVYLLFQPAEERVRGAAALLESQVITHADYFLSGHIGLAANRTGMLGAMAVNFMATTKLQVVFYGRASHAAAAECEGRSALVAASRAVVELETWKTERGAEQSRHIGSGKTGAMGRVNIGTFQSGTALNIVPSRAILGIETRGLTDQVNREMVAIVKTICETQAASTGCRCETQVVGEAPTAVCDNELRDCIVSHAKRNSFFKDIRSELEFSASEDAATLINAVQAHGGQACYLMFGCDLASSHHSSTFDFDESVLEEAVELYVHVAEELCNRP